VGHLRYAFEADLQLIRIGAGAVDSCSALKSIVLPSKLEMIGESCFAECGNLETAILANDSKLVRIERVAFARCSSLESL
jgi:hypothetical protein